MQVPLVDDWGSEIDAGISPIGMATFTFLVDFVEIDVFLGFQPTIDPMSWSLMAFDNEENQIDSASFSTLGTLDFIPSTLRADAPGQIASIMIDRDADFVIDTITFGGQSPPTHVPVPEPPTFALLVIGFAGIGLARRRRKA